MSHTTTLKTVKIVDIDALQDAVDYLNEYENIKCSLLTNVKPRMWYENQSGICDYVVKLPCQFDVGFKKTSDGSYEMIFDAHANVIRSYIGAPMNVKADSETPAALLAVSRLVDLYAIHAAKNQLQLDGYSYDTTIEYNEEDYSYSLTVGSAY